MSSSTDQPAKSFPDDSIVVLGFSKSEDAWIPVAWMSEHACWLLELKDGTVTAIYDQDDILTWIDMADDPKDEVKINPESFYDKSTGEKVKLLHWGSVLYGFAEVEKGDGDSYLAAHSDLERIRPNAQS